MSAKSKKKRRDTSMNDVYEEDYKNREASGSGGTRFLNTSDYEDVEFYSIKKGRNEIDIIPYEITNKNHPQGREIGKFDYKLDVWVHRFINEKDHFLCLKKTFDKPCPICEEVRKMLDSDEYTKDDNAVKQLFPKRRVVYNVIDLRDDDQKIKIFETSHFEFQSELIEEAESGEEGEFIPFADLEEGSSISFRGVERKGEFRSGSPQPKGFKFIDREESYEDNILDDVYSLDAMLVIPTYDDVKKAFIYYEEDDISEDEFENEEEDTDCETKSKKTKTRKIKKEDEAKKKTKKTSSKCPADGEFGKDCDELEECENCKLWDDCSKEYDNLNG